METENYHLDKLEVLQDQEGRAAVKITEIEDRCSAQPVSFIKANYGYVKLRNRKSEPEIKFLIGAALLKSALHLGLKGIDKLHKPDILNAIFNHYSDLTLEEIYKAFELERYGLYEAKTEHFQLFNADYVTTILKKYRALKGRLKSEHNILPSSQKPNELSQEEKEKMVEDAVNRVFVELKETKDIDGPTEYIFDFLVKKGKIKTKGSTALVEYYSEKLSEAKEQLRKEKLALDPKSPAEKKEKKIDLERIVSGQSNKILIRAKKNILIEYFIKQIQLNQETIF